jgi:exosortase/archaeosortase family protein
MKYWSKLVLRLVFGLLFVLVYGVFYEVLRVLTIYPSYFLINLGYSVGLVGNSLFFGGNVVNFIPACIAAVAYALLLFLIIFTKGIGFGKSVKMFVLGSLLILIMNVIRIDLLLVILFEFGPDMFDNVHLVFWNFISGIYVAFVWIFLVKKFKVSGIPIVSDVRYLYKRINS